MAEKQIYSIRGATTIKTNTDEEIQTAAVQLFNEIKKQNNFDNSDIVNIIISSTGDITAGYPAKALRIQCNLAETPLFSCLEPPIKNNLPLCIRFLITVMLKEKPKPVYLNSAVCLRPDITNVISIAIDGPAGAGKSTVAKMVAKKLGIAYLDTGAMYRALALKVGGNYENIEKTLENTSIDVQLNGDVQSIYLDGVDVSLQIRTPQISMQASSVSAIPCVRVKMAELQRKIAGKTSCVLDGRDIGTYVLPNAKYKFFLTASVEARAQRRFDELIQKGQSVTLESIKADIIVRDAQDSSRALAPLKQADDAILIDTTDITADNAADKIYGYIL